MKTIPFLFAFLPLLAFSADLPKQLTNLTMLDGYAHEALQGIDSVVGKISKKDGISMTYDIGPVRQPGVPGFGGDYSNRVTRHPEKLILWRTMQTVAGEEVHVGHATNGYLMASFPKRGVNLSAKVETHQQVADFLLMAMTVPVPKK